MLRRERDIRKICHDKIHRATKNMHRRFFEKGGHRSRFMPFFVFLQLFGNMTFVGFPHFEMLKMLKTFRRKRQNFQGFSVFSPKIQQVFNIFGPIRQILNNYETKIHFSVISGFRPKTAHFAAFVTKAKSALIFLCYTCRMHYEYFGVPIDTNSRICPLKFVKLAVLTADFEI